MLVRDIVGPRPTLDFMLLFARLVSLSGPFDCDDFLMPFQSGLGNRSAYSSFLETGVSIALRFRALTP